MGLVRYDSYTDKFIYEEDLVSTTATFTGCIHKPFEITEEAIEKIADAVVRKLRSNQTILDGNSYIRGFTDGRESMRKLFEQTEPQSGYCNECEWYGDKQVCGRCRSRNLYTPKDEPSDDCQWK